MHNRQISSTVEPVVGPNAQIDEQIRNEAATEVMPMVDERLFDVFSERLGPGAMNIMMRNKIREDFRKFSESEPNSDADAGPVIIPDTKAS
jgi:hypothetical protein